ncbi:MAG: LytTR family transcriptional regulator DNA-binding domain-containing protein [Lachnospiraceae bacterium]|nr:LytTR family transcriptional regulator DNA-binding domain-containing protein [Lachnospiraceae bacterium]
MATYIAICDNNTADRKHLERLLNRESEQRIHNSGVLYIDSYGSEEALLMTPMRYDLFLIDMAGERNGYDIAKALRTNGVICPICLCSSKIDYEQEYADENFIYIRKPFVKADLTSLLDFCIEEQKHRTPLLELRDEIKTYYVSSDEIKYARSDDRFVDIYLNGDRKAHILGDIYDIDILLDGNDNFLQTGKISLVNMDYISGMVGRAFEMTDGELISFNFFDQKKIMTQYMQYQSKHRTL